MKSLWPLKLLLLLCLLFSQACKEEDSQPEPEFESFREEMDYLVDKYVKMGAAIGIIDGAQELHEYYIGSLSRNRRRPPDEHSIFEIGSITKSFTATLLAHMVVEGKIQLEDELRSLLPTGKVEVPKWNNTPITLKHLATHSSGLPKKPHNSGQSYPSGYDPYDPYAAYTTVHVYNYLGSYCELEYEPGTGYAYSNTGMGLVGHVLGLVDGSSYEEALKRVVLEPLGMKETMLFLSESQIPNLAPGHDQILDSVPNYHAQDIFQGAGFLKSSLHDMLIYLKAQMKLSGNALDDAIALTHRHHFKVGTVTYGDREGVYDLSIGLAWHIDLLPEGHTFHLHGGRTNGYMAYMAFDQDSSTGLVILCNQSHANTIIRFGEDLLKAVNKYSPI